MTAAAAALVSTDLDFFKHDRDFHLSTPPLFFTFLIPTRYYFYTFLASFKKKFDFWSNSKVLHVKTFFFCWRLIGKLFDAKISTAINWVSEQEREREEIKIKSIHQIWSIIVMMMIMNMCVKNLWWIENITVVLKMKDWYPKWTHLLFNWRLEGFMVI